MRVLSILILALINGTFFSAIALAEEAKSDRPVIIVVMDPLAKPLSCPCVAGYAQRDYEKLAMALKSSIGREVEIIFNESLIAAQKKNEQRQIDLVIGKQSVILNDAKAAKLALKKVAMLTGKDGLTTQRGLVVVATSDPARQISDLSGYHIYFGPAECDEKHAAAMRLLQNAGVVIPEKLETAVACDEGAMNILELAEKDLRGCALISSYAKPLLEGCGQVPKGALRVVGETEEVPFIAAYVNSALPQDVQSVLSESLIKSTAADVRLRLALETKHGFVVEDDGDGDLAKKK